KRLTDFIVQFARDRAALALLNLKQTVRQFLQLRARLLHFSQMPCGGAFIGKSLSAGDHSQHQAERESHSQGGGHPDTVAREKFSPPLFAVPCPTSSPVPAPSSSLLALVPEYETEPFQTGSASACITVNRAPVHCGSTRVLPDPPWQVPGPAPAHSRVPMCPR